MHKEVTRRQTAEVSREDTTCTECGQTLARGSTRAASSGLKTPERSEYQEYCPGCYELNEQGERVLVTSAHDSDV
jgi:uncharacterized protein with PIN domain